MLENLIKNRFARSLALAAGLAFSTPYCASDCGGGAQVEDADGDGLPDELEIRIGTDPDSSDSDGDGVPDGGEDSDGDSYNNLAEYMAGTDPSDRSSYPMGANRDAGVLDSGVRYDSGIVNDRDDDNDGLPNPLEMMIGTDPNNSDTDGDGFDDGFEYNNGYSPSDRNDNPNNRMDAGYLDAMVMDSGGGNQPPVARAGPDKILQRNITECFNFANDTWNTASCGQVNGYGSIDRDGTIIDYKIWRDYQNNPNSWNQNNDGHFSIVYFQLGTFILRLEVTDNNGETNTDEATITVNN